MTCSGCRTTWTSGGACIRATRTCPIWGPTAPGLCCCLHAASRWAPGAWTGSSCTASTSRAPWRGRLWLNGEYNLFFKLSPSIPIMSISLYLLFLMRGPDNIMSRVLIHRTKPFFFQCHWFERKKLHRCIYPHFNDNLYIEANKINFFVAGLDHYSMHYYMYIHISFMYIKKKPYLMIHCTPQHCFCYRNRETNIHRYYNDN